MEKIYSRWKIRNYDQKKLRKTIKFIAIILITICIANSTINAIEPVIDASSKEMAKSIATKISNEQATVVMR